jgi:glycosyltransferase involved in cell wall biosynthesis
VYKRIEWVLDMLTELPEVRLDIAGHGDHGETLEDEISRRGLTERVTVHGWVDEQAKADLYRQAWLHVTASASEGWSLTVMEAALCATPSVAMRVGGLRESIVDGTTGLLSDSRRQLTANVRRLLADDQLRAQMGEAARERALTFTWERTAATTLAVVQQQVLAASAQPRRP